MKAAANTETNLAELSLVFLAAKRAAAQAKYYTYREQ